MIKVLDDYRIEVETTEDVKEELREFLDTYASQYKEMTETYKWIKDKLNREQRLEWERTVEAPRDICKALDLGFDPATPPRNWASGQLVQYVAPIPADVREKIDLAEPIFGRNRILIYDPNKEHFQRPKVVDPIVLGFIDLARERLHFLIGQWDLKADLNFIKGTKITSPINRVADRVNEVIEYFPVDTRKLWHDKFLVKSPVEFH